MIPRFSQRSFQTRVPFYLALLLLVLSLFISLLSNTGLYVLFSQAREREASNRLKIMARVAETQIAQAAEYTMLAMLDDTLLPVPEPNDDQAWRDFMTSLADLDREHYPRIATNLRLLSAQADSQSVVLISPQGRIISTSDGIIAPGLLASIPPQDMDAYTEALSGQPASVVNTQGDRARIHVYAPVRLLAPAEFAGRVGAVLQLKTEYEALSEVRTLGQGAIVLAAIITGLLAVVAFLFYRLMHTFAKMSERAAHTDRLQAMGTLTAGIAHEIRNPLGIIRALSEGLQDDFDKDDPRREMVEDISGEVERLNRLVNQYLQFARPDTAEPGADTNPADMIRNLALLIEKGDRNQASVSVSIQEPVPRVALPAGSLRQVLLNLIMNAREASRADQTVNVECTALRGGSMVQIIVSDQGRGIPRRDLRSVFDPFFTTSPDGTGLGLAICRQIVTECGGDISIDSRQGQGTRVTVLLPTKARQLQL